MILTSPDVNQRVSRLVDWMEILAIQQPERSVGTSEVDKLLRIQDSGRESRRSYDQETGEDLEQEILAEGNSEVLRSTVAELERRSSTLGDHYPFDFEEPKSALGGAPKIKLRGFGRGKEGRAAYICCLLISAIRHGIITIDAKDSDVLTDTNLVHSEYRYGQILQVCATVALGGYLGGEVYSFGYPRPDGSTFLAAHQSIWQQFGAYAPVENVPVGAPNQENDAGIDLIGWLDFGDKMGAKILVIGQVASGRNWSGKSVVDRAKSLKGWFGGASYEWFTPAMVMPFNITDARATIQEVCDPYALRRATLEHEERQFGIMLDRDRISIATASAFQLKADETSKIQGFEDFDLVVEWSQKVIEQLRS